MTAKNAHIIHDEGAPREGRIFPLVANVERNIKLTFPHLNIRQNATLSSNPSLVYPTVYLSPLVTLTAKGYTKHYFEGSRRICSSVGGGFSRVDWDSIARKHDEGLMEACDGLVSRLEEGCIVYGVSQAKPLSDSGDFLRFGSEVHRTSSSYGEDWVDISTFNFIRRFPRLNIRASSSVFGLSETFAYDTAQVGFYRFNIAEVERRASLLALPRCSNVIEDNGKEKDPETGFLYYGARYHWPEVWTGWLSPDPMMDVYPGISPYNYCNWNPVIFVDPDGREAGDPLKVMKIRRMRLSNTFGMVRHRADGTLKPHQGIDYYAPQGTPVYAVKDGTIVDIGTQGDYGKTITLEFKQDDGTMAYAFYAHLSAQNVKVGQTVYEGDEIGLTGNTGNASNMKGEDEHLHFEYRTGGSNLGLGLKGRDNPNLIVDTKFEIDPNNSNKVVQVRPILEPKHKCILK